MIQEFIEELSRSWRHHRVLHIASLLTLSVSFTIIMSFFVLSNNLRDALVRWGNSMQMTVYLHDNITQDQQSQLMTALKELEGVENTQYLSKAEAIEVFEKKMGSYAPDFVKDKETDNPLPASIIVNLKKVIGWSGVDEKTKVLAEKAQLFTGVESVSFGQDWLSTYAGLIGGLNQIAIVVGLALLLGAGFVVSSVIKASIYQRSSEIEIFELVGATAEMIRRPFIVEGAVLGFVASCFALFATYAFYHLQVGYLSTYAEFHSFVSQFHFLSIWGAFGLLIMGTGVGALSSFVIVRKINDGWMMRGRLSN